MRINRDEDAAIQAALLFLRNLHEFGTYRIFFEWVAGPAHYIDSSLEVPQMMIYTAHHLKVLTKEQQAMASLMFTQARMIIGWRLSTDAIRKLAQLAKDEIR